MAFGNVVATDMQAGAPVNRIRGLLAEYLCDGVSRPNPGTTKLIVHDGSVFLKLGSPPGGNHSAVYFAIFEALSLAAQRRAAEVEISLASTFVWGQITGNEGVDELGAQRAKARQLAGHFHRVSWHLVEAPFALPQGIAADLPALRRMAP